VNLWTFNVDTLRLSGYFYKDRGKKLTYGPIWDFDRALFSTDGRDANPKTWRSQTGDLGTDFFNYPWWRQWFLDLDFYQQYIDKWFILRKGSFSPASANGLLDALNNELGSEAVDRDFLRWRQAKRSWTSPFTGQAYTGQAAEVQRIKDWLQQRADFFDSQWVVPVVISPEGNVPAGTQVTLSRTPVSAGNPAATGEI